MIIPYFLNIMECHASMHEYGNNHKLDKKVCEQTLSWLAKAGPESFKKFGKF